MTFIPAILIDKEYCIASDNDSVYCCLLTIKLFSLNLRGVGSLLTLHIISISEIFVVLNNFKSQFHDRLHVYSNETIKIIQVNKQFEFMAEDYSNCSWEHFI